MSAHVFRQIMVTIFLLLLSFLWGIYIHPQLSGVGAAKLVIAFIQPIIAFMFLLCYLIVLRFSHEPHHHRHVHVGVLANLLIIFSLFMSMLTQWFVMGGGLQFSQFIVPTIGLFLMLVGYVESSEGKFNYWYLLGFILLFGIFSPALSFAAAVIVFVFIILQQRIQDFFQHS